MHPVVAGTPAGHHRRGEAVTALGIGILGASRIAREAIVGPAKATGHRLVAVAARDRSRADAFAVEHGVERVHDEYIDVLEDPEVELLYNPLSNALHAPWNLRAIAAGKPVLCEKPSASNLGEAQQVHQACAASGVFVVEGFHYLYHPLMDRLQLLLDRGELGELRAVEVDLVMEAPPDGDPRWSLELAGGAMMDLGCYAVHLARMLARWADGEPTVVSATCVERAGRRGVDEKLTAQLVYPSGATARVHCDMAAPTRAFNWRVAGSRGEAWAANFVKPHLDDRLTTLMQAGGRQVEHVGTRPSYDYQLEAVAAHLRDGAPLPIDAADAVVQMRLVDDCYSAAGLKPRPSMTVS